MVVGKVGLSLAFISAPRDIAEGGFTSCYSLTASDIIKSLYVVAFVVF